MIERDKERPIITERVREIVYHLAGTIGSRSLASPKTLEEAALYVEGLMAEAGYEVERELYEAPGGHMARNLIAEKAG